MASSLTGLWLPHYSKLQGRFMFKVRLVVAADNKIVGVCISLFSESIFTIYQGVFDQKIILHAF